MATFKSDLSTGQTAKGDNRADGRLLSGKVRNANATYVTVGTEDTGDVIQLVELPEDAIVDWSSSYAVVKSALGTTFTVNLGTEASPNIVTNISASSYGKKTLSAVGLYNPPAGDNKFCLTVTDAAAVNADAEIRVCLSFIDYN